MANSFKVNAQFTAKGNFDKKFSLWERAAARFGKNAEKSFRKAGRSASRFGDVTKGVVAGLGISRGLSLLSQGVGSVVTQFIAFDKAALGATVRFKDIGPEAANFNEKLKEIEKSARDMGAVTEFTAAQNAEALDFLARAGFTSAEAMGSLKSMVDLATATGEEFNSVADISSDLLGAFGLNAKDTATKVANLNRLNNALVSTVNSANVTMENLFDTMTKVGPVATGLFGASVEEIAALTGVLGSSGIKGSNAMTALTNIFLRLAAPTSKASKMIKSLNIDMVDLATGEPRKITDILEEVVEKTKDLGKIPRAKVFDLLFGKRAIAGATNLGRNIGDIRELNKQILEAGDISRLTAEVMRKSIENKLKSLGSAATESGFKILDAFAVDGKQGIDALTEAIREFDVKPLVEGLGIALDAIKLISKTAAFAFNLLIKIGEFGGESAAKIVSTLTGGEDATAAFRQEVQQRQAEAAGFGVDLRDKEPQRVGPNQQEAAAKAQFPGFQGQLNIAGAPEGSTLETSKPGPAGFSVALLGAN